MNSTVVLLLGLLPVSIFVMWPLFTGDDEDVEPPHPEDESAGLERQKHDAFAALKEAEFDQRTGKLSTEDYDKLVARYKGQAIEAITALDRQRPAASPVAEPQPDGGAPAARFCPSCGTRKADNAKFCGGCGATLPQTL